MKSCLLICCLWLSALALCQEPAPTTYRPFSEAARYRLPAGMLVVAEGQGNVLRGAQQEEVLVLGIPGADPNNMFFTQLYLLVRPRGEQGVLTPFPREVASGYQPRLRVLDFTGDRLDDPFMQSETGGSGGIVNGVIYTFRRGRPEAMFISIMDILPRFGGRFLPNYQAVVTVRTPADERYCASGRTAQ